MLFRSQLRDRRNRHPSIVGGAFSAGSTALQAQPQVGAYARNIGEFPLPGLVQARQDSQVGHLSSFAQQHGSHVDQQLVDQARFEQRAVELVTGFDVNFVDVTLSQVLHHGVQVDLALWPGQNHDFSALAASLASGLDGIANHIEPPPIFEGDVYAARTLPRVPYTLEHAVDLFENSEFAKAQFGAAVVEHYAHFYRTEQKAFERVVTDWERRRYFERI